VAPVRESSTLSLVRREPELIGALLAEKDSVGALFERSRLVTARKMLETAGHWASLAELCHWHMVKRERCVAQSAASYSAFHCRTLFFEARRGSEYTYDGSQSITNTTGHDVLSREAESRLSANHRAS